jgi:hypothetical protein
MLLIWGLRVIYRTLGQGVFFCRRCGGDREYRHRAGRRFITVFFIPLVPLAKTGEHVQCLTCKTRYVTEVLRLPTTADMQLALSAGMRALVVAMLRVGDPANPLARRRAIDAVVGTGEPGYDDAALDADLEGPTETEIDKIAAFGGQLQVEAKEWYFAEAIRIALADGPLTRARRRRAAGSRARHDPGPGHRRHRPDRAERRPELIPRPAPAALRSARASGAQVRPTLARVRAVRPRSIARTTAPTARAARSRVLR